MCFVCFALSSHSLLLSDLQPVTRVRWQVQTQLPKINKTLTQAEGGRSTSSWHARTISLQINSRSLTDLLIYGVKLSFILKTRIPFLNFAVIRLRLYKLFIFFFPKNPGLTSALNTEYLLLRHHMQPQTWGNEKVLPVHMPILFGLVAKISIFILVNNILLN